MSTAPPLRAVWLGTVPYLDAWRLQQRLASERRDGLQDDALLLLEHPPVYTMGRNGEPEHVPGGAAAIRALGAEYHEVDRGGSVTFHGPGQLVAYPVVLLAEALPLSGRPEHGDVIRYLRVLEDALIATCASVGVAAERRPPYTGAWCGREKIAAIGVKLARGVTTHGIALNGRTDLDWFSHVVPCGITDGGVTSLAARGATGTEPAALAPVFARELAQGLQRDLAGADTRLLGALESEGVVLPARAVAAESPAA